jgi:putative ABC transport system permease protein
MFGRKRQDKDFGAEIEAHLALEAERLQQQGLSAAEARAAARRAFGNVAHAQERFHESGRWLFADHLSQDLRFALRGLRKSPAFTAVAGLTIALGVGATTAIFSVVNATLLQPLPYPHPEQLVAIEDNLRGTGARNVGISQPEWQDLQHSGIFEYASPAWFDENNLTGSSAPARVSLLIVAPDYFALLGVKPQLGSIFDPDTYTPGFTGEVIISDGLWKRSYAGDPGVLGRTLRLDTDLYRIIGVMPPGFYAPGASAAERSTEVWAATSFFGAPMPDEPPRSRRYMPETIARIQPGLTLAAAQSRVDALVANLTKQYPADYPPESGWTIRLVPLKDMVVGNIGQSLILLLGAVALVLLIVCVNVASLLLARASARETEMAIRQALGAGRARLMRQLLTESLLLALLGGTAGLLLLLAAQGFLLRFAPQGLPRLGEVSIDWAVLLFALSSSVAAALIFGLAPALQAGRLELTGALKEGGRGSTGSGKQARTRRVLVVTEFALSLVLMVTATLLLRSFRDLLNVPPGFNPSSAMVVRTRVPYPNLASADRYATPLQQSTFIREVLRRTATLPGVEEVALGDSGSIPLDSSQRELNLLAGQFFFKLEGREMQAGQTPLVDRWMVTPGYFNLLKIPLLRGRLFDEHDDDKAPQVAVVNEAFARTYWPAESALGKRLRSDRAVSPWITVVGVVANVRTESLAEAEVPQIYVSLYQTFSHHLAIFVRGQLDAAVIGKGIRDQVQAVDGGLPVYGAQRLEETVSTSLSQRRFSLQVVILFALTALFLAAIGIYGVISYTVTARTHEIGVRLALGAGRSDIVRMVLRHGLRLAVAGTAVGSIAALLAGRLMAGLLYGVRPWDPVTFAGVALVLVGVGALACYLPARRAVQVDPMVALRCE